MRRLIHLIIAMLLAAAFGFTLGDALNRSDVLELRRLCDEQGALIEQLTGENR